MVRLRKTILSLEGVLMIAITMTYRSISKEAYFLKNETVGVTRVANFRKGLECGARRPAGRAASYLDFP